MFAIVWGKWSCQNLPENLKNRVKLKTSRFSEYLRGRIHRKIPFWAISSAESCVKRDFRRKPWIACRLENASSLIFTKSLKFATFYG